MTRLTMTDVSSPSEIAAQRLRLSRVMMSFAVYVVCLALLFLLKLSNRLQMPWTWLVVLAVMALVINGIFRYMITSGFNLRCKDHSLTQWQMSVALFWSLPCFYYGENIRAEALMVFICVFVFGIFRLNRRELLTQGLVVTGIYFSMLLWERQFSFSDISIHEWTRLSFLIMTLTVIAYLGGEHFAMRQRLKEKHKALARANQLISKQATHDSLTGVYNRHYLMDALVREEARHKRIGAHLSVIICDIDHFKKINERFGHVVGDELLKAFVETLHQSLRVNDLIAPCHDHVLARYGGEEFMLVLPDTGVEGARLCAERLRKEIELKRFQLLPEGVKLTASFGVAQIRLGEKISELIQRAENALADAKQSGRNRVAVDIYS